MKHIKLLYSFTDDLALKEVEFQFNDTGLEDNSDLLKKVSIAMLKSIYHNEDSLAVQDLLNTIEGIQRAKESGCNHSFDTYNTALGVYQTCSICGYTRPNSKKK